jgi:hypothetical protein
MWNIITSLRFNQCDNCEEFSTKPLQDDVYGNGYYCEECYEQGLEDARDLEGYNNLHRAGGPLG